MLERPKGPGRFSGSFGPAYSKRTLEMKKAYLDCFSGVSGDMFLAALLDAGLPREELVKALQSLPLAPFQISTTRETRKSITGIRLTVAWDDKDSVSRHLADIKGIIEGGNLAPGVKEKSIAVFERLAEAEGSVHGLSPDEIHFHEVGAVDSIVDIVGTVYGLHYLGINSLSLSPLPLGTGFVETMHGTIPVPAPATVALLKGVPVYQTDIPYEMVTPTGAALAKVLAVSFGPMPPMVVERVGYGIGKRDLEERPNLVRVLIGGESFAGDTESVLVMESNLDDAPPEWMGHLMERLFEEGALDVVFFPIQMKKNRPGVQIQVMAEPEKMDALLDVLFEESTALGVRFGYSQRKVLERSTAEVESPWGILGVKKVTGRNGGTLLLPEYEICRKIARERGVPLKEIYYWVMSLNR